MQAGLTIAVVGLFISILAASSTHYDDLTGMQVSGSPIAGILIILLGLVLAGIGFARRVLAAIEHREESPRAEDPAA